MIKQQAEGVLNILSNHLDRRLNLVLEPAHKKEIMTEMNIVLSGLITQPQPQPDIPNQPNNQSPIKVPGEEIPRKGLKQDEDKK